MAHPGLRAGKVSNMSLPLRSSIHGNGAAQDYDGGPGVLDDDERDNGNCSGDGSDSDTTALTMMR